MNDGSKLDVWSHIETIEPQHRLVLLGASNLSRAFPMVVRMAQDVFAGPLSIHAAMGFGRSYGKESRFLIKKNLGIFQSKIWDALEQKKSFSTTAFLTDIGNDLAYEVSVDQLLEWIEGCVNRLQSIDAKLVITEVPLDVLRSVEETRFRVFRTLLFPQCRLDWSEMLRRAELLSEGLQELAETRNIPLFVGNTEWYRWDPIHPRRATLPLLWHQLFKKVELIASESSQRSKSLRMDWYLRGLQLEKWSSVFSLRRTRLSNRRLIDGTEIALY